MLLPAGISISFSQKRTGKLTRGREESGSLDQPYEGADHDSFQYYLIDGFIVSDNIQVEEMKNLDLDFRYSDHNPVILRISL